MIFLLLQQAMAQDLKFNADAKSFFLASFPYEHLLMNQSPFGQAFLDGRLKVKARLFPSLRLVAHHAITMGTTAPSNQLSQELEAFGQEIEEFLPVSF